MADRRASGFRLRSHPDRAETSREKISPIRRADGYLLHTSRGRRDRFQLRYGNDELVVEDRRAPEIQRQTRRVAERYPRPGTLEKAEYAMTTATFNIGGMHCPPCALRNERALKKFKGVVDATINF